MKKTFMKSFWHYSVEYCFQELNSSRDGLSSEVVNKLSETFVKKDTFLSKVKNEFPMYFRYYLSPLNIPTNKSLYCVCPSRLSVWHNFLLYLFFQFHKIRQA